MANAISIRPAVLDDVSKLVKLQYLVRKDDPVFRAKFPLRDSSDYNSLHSDADWFLYSSLRDELEGVGSSVGAKVYVAETAGNEIVGYTLCHPPESPNHLPENRSMGDTKQGHVNGINVPFVFEYMETYFAMLDKHVQDGKYWELGGVFINPDYEGLGIASMLTAPIFRAASQSNEIIWITSSSVSKEMYEELGCEQIDFAIIKIPPTEDTITSYYYRKNP